MQQLNFEKTKGLLEKYKFPLVKSLLIKSEKNIPNASSKTGFPAVLKISSPDIIHKSDVGGVKTNLENKEQIFSAYSEIIKNIKKKKARAKIEGMVLQKQIEGQEIIVGVKRDPQFDVVLMFGMGGIFVEILKDISIRVAPVNKQEAIEMIREIKTINILEGARGKKPVNLEAIAHILVKAGKMALENKKIAELDFNPVIVDDKKAQIADARIMVEK
jgi:acetyl-CoA synthetase (ADP-forming)